VEWRHLYGPSAAGDLEWFDKEATKVHHQYAGRLEKIQEVGKEMRQEFDGK
jgi:hypothetical protein